MNTIRVNRAISDLLSEGCHPDDLAPVREWMANVLREEAERRAVPSEDDTAHPLLGDLSIDEHLARRSRGEPNPLSCAITEGRQYELTDSQRAILREWFNMIPTPSVEVVSIAVFDGSVSPLRIAREVILRTTVHRPSGTVENAPRKVVIKEWGRFMRACAQRDAEAREERELSALRARIHDLFKKAKKHNVFPEASAGGIAQQWHALINEREIAKIEDVLARQAAKRDLLREVLLNAGESELCALVKDPTFFPATRDEEEYGALMKMLNIS